MSVVHFNEENARDLNQSIPKKKVFLLIYMEGCKPCMKMKPEWAKIENIFKKQDKNILIGDIERTHLPQLNNLKYEVNSFPTILYLSKNNNVETFEDAGFQERNIDNFMKWINTKCKKITHLPKISFQEDTSDKVLPYTFDLNPDEDLCYIDRKTLARKFDVFEKYMLSAILVGIDTETKPCRFKRIKCHPTSLLQIAVRTGPTNSEIVFIVDLLSLAQDEVYCLGKLDEVLTPCFRNKDCIKIGQGLDNDMKEMCKAYPMMQSFKEINGCVETNTFLKYLEPERKQHASLKLLVKTFLNFNLVKTQQLSDWGKRPLTTKQLHYAACDALVLLRLYDAMICEVEYRKGVSAVVSSDVAVTRDPHVDAVVYPDYNLFDIQLLQQTFIIANNRNYSSYSSSSRSSATVQKKIKPKTRKIGRKKIYKLKGGKWTRKYKKSINCNKPKGFSQRQYCKYGRH